MRRLLALALALVVAALVAPAAPSTAQTAEFQPAFPGIRAAFYYPWFPEGWNQEGVQPFSRYEPTLGYYRSDDPRVIRSHIAAMQHAGIEAGISSWFGPGDINDDEMALLLEAAAGTNFRWAMYHEDEGYGNPSPEQIAADLRYIHDRYSRHPAFLKIGGRPVIFVYNDVEDTCDLAHRWRAGNVINAHLVFKLFAGWERCPGDSMHQYAPGLPYIGRREFVVISPGFWRAAGEPQPRLPRDLNRWNRDIRAMVAAQPPWELVTSFNEWGEGTSVEATKEWGTAYLDALARNGQELFPERRRIAGGDRYDTAARLAEERWPLGSTTVYVASGEAFPDALAGGAAAGTRNAPVLLTARDVLPAATERALRAMRPLEVVVLGGSSAVSDAVLARIAEQTRTLVRRRAGHDRYATAAEISRTTFEAARRVFVANGAAFADGLAAGAAGAAVKAPVLLAETNRVPDATVDELRRLRPGRVSVVGGRGVLSDDVVRRLSEVTGVAVERLAGADRYGTAVAVSAAVRTGPVNVLLATGESFPDALAGAAAATSEALVLVPRTCVPDRVYDELKRLAPTRSTVLGGQSAVADWAGFYGACRR